MKSPTLAGQPTFESGRSRAKGMALVLIVLFGFAAVLFVLPLARLFLVGLAPEGALTLGPLAEALQSRSTQRAIINSLDSALLSALPSSQDHLR